MKKIILIFLLITFNLFGNFQKDSSKIIIGISSNFFTKSQFPIGIEFNFKKSVNNIYGFGSDYTLYYIRKLTKIHKNIIFGAPLILNQNPMEDIDSNLDYLSNFIQIAPLIGYQIEIGKSRKRFARIRINYSPFVLDVKRNSKKTFINKSYFNHLGFGAVFLIRK